MIKKLLIFTISLLLSSCFSKQEVIIKPSEIHTGNIAKFYNISKEEKIEQFKRRTNFKSLIRKWDYYSIRNMKETALQYYLNAYEKLKNDIVLEKKIADSLFELKNYTESFKYYSKLPTNEIKKESEEKMILSLMYSKDENILQKLKSINISQDQKDYYSIVNTCYSWIKNCIETIKVYSWSYEKTIKLKNIILNFEKAQGIDSNSKYALMAWFFLENKDFLAAALIWEETITKRSNYKSVLKITGYAYYELWEYKKANDYLQRYYNLDPKDIKVAYLLWIINFILENYISSNLYFNAAVLNWYSPKTELERRLVYNYYIIWDEKNMFKVFRYLLDEKDVAENDYSVAIFTAIEYKELSKALLWSNKWMQRFNNSDVLYWLRGWIYKIRNEEYNSKNDLNKALSLNPKNAIALLNLWIWSFEKKDYNIAKSYFKNTIEVDKDWILGFEAQNQLKKLEEQIKLEESLTWSTNSGIVN